MSKKSGLQLQVLSLYRHFLRAVNKKSPETAANLKGYVQSEFRKFSTIHRFDTANIEYRLRLGVRQLERLRSSSMEGFNVVSPASHHSPSQPANTQ